MALPRQFNQFPRTANLPAQSSKYWAKEKDRYLRQLLICDIEAETEREIVVYFSRMDQSIIDSDSDDISEIFEGLGGKSVDLIIHTPGGYVDATEKLISVLKIRCDNFRVIVPSAAKSGGTLIALASDKILLGVNSELGPIDPQLNMHGVGAVPAEYVAADPSQQFVVQQIALASVKRSRAMAQKYLSEGMLKGKTTTEIEEVVGKISSTSTYNSHGAVIDHEEAKSLGLSVEWMTPESELWKQIWLLYCLYDYDIAQNNLGKIFEGRINSIARLPLSF